MLQKTHLQEVLPTEQPSFFKEKVLFFLTLKGRHAPHRPCEVRLRSRQRHFDTVTSLQPSATATQYLSMPKSI